MLGENSRPAPILRPLTVGDGRPKMTLVRNSPIAVSHQCALAKELPNGASKQAIAVKEMAKVRVLGKHPCASPSPDRFITFAFDHHGRVNVKLQSSATVSDKSAIVMDHPPNPMRTGDHGLARTSNFAPRPLGVAELVDGLPG